MGQHSQIKMVGVHQSGNRGQFKRVSSARKLTFYDTKKEPVGSFFTPCHTESANKLGRQHDDAFALHFEFSFQLTVTYCQGALVNGVSQFLPALLHPLHLQLLPLVDRFLELRIFLLKQFTPARIS